MLNYLKNFNKEAVSNGYYIGNNNVPQALNELYVNEMRFVSTKVGMELYEVLQNRDLFKHWDHYPKLREFIGGYERLSTKGNEVNLPGVGAPEDERLTHCTKTSSNLAKELHRLSLKLSKESEFTSEFVKKC